MGAIQQILLAATPASGGPFDPLTLSNLVAWYDFSLLTGTTGDLVPTLTDSSGNGHTFTQTGDPRATLATAAVNGKNVLRFDGFADFYLKGFSFASSTWTVVAIYAKPSAGGHPTNQRIVSACGASSDYVDGLIISEPTNATYSPKGVLSILTSRAPTHLGFGREILPGGATDSSWFAGDLCEVILCNGSMPTGEQANVRSYASTKWGVTIP